jgi:hypothetical protein
MTRRALPIVLGAVLYVALTFAIYGLQRLAFPTGSGPYPTWFASAEVLLKGIGAVAPGFLAAWLYARPGFAIGAITGVCGVIAEFIIAIIGFSIPLGEFGGRMAAGLVAAGAAAALTNGTAGMAAEALRKRRQVAL